VKIPRDLSGREFARLLARLGYIVTRQRGSHIRLTLAATDVRAEHNITIPAYDGLKVGTLAAILDEVAGVLGITREALMELLFE
jgi:predicted RNA binding protein YcfA (HicA-like mRNA interferase family)